MTSRTFVRALSSVGRLGPECPPLSNLMWRGNDFLSKIVNGRSERYMTTWTRGNPSGGDSAFSATPKATYAYNSFPPGTSDLQFRFGAPVSSSDEAGYITSYQDDEDYFTATRRRSLPSRRDASITVASMVARLEHGRRHRWLVCRGHPSW